ncbi:hypothetical protein TRFO_05643 [Tritrichomonas foetus]|uniref:Uncharacterized protein n=1 Tax=Tritrichomonas foetus TaxID=1144522 RepID=A0A1J4K4V6_9EUKA|nr:hypothetical protein TRFO_05643 [Tritrichomonas foetus]|eukprot:OHT06010.1 hypothetical protein TRFO_05643 [Tritrichomonas foetus]
MIYFVFYVVILLINFLYDQLSIEKIFQSRMLIGTNNNTKSFLESPSQISMENYKKDKIEKENSKKTLQNKSENQEFGDYLLIDDACKGIETIINLFIDDPESRGDALFNILKVFQSFLKNQKVVNIPESFFHFKIMEHLFSIILNNDEIYEPRHISESIICLSYLYKSESICSTFISNDLLSIICEMVRDNVFPNILGYLIEIIRIFIDIDHSLLNLVNSIIPFQFMIETSTKNINLIDMFSSYFYDYIDFLKPISPDNQFEFLKFCSFCYDKKLKKTYQFNLWSLFLLMTPDSFLLDQFYALKLNEFVDSAILLKSNTCVYPALLIIQQFYTLFQLPENFQIENIIMIPIRRSELDSDNQALAINTLERAFKYDLDLIVLADKYQLLDYLISNFSEFNYKMKNAVSSLFMHISTVVGDEFLENLIDNGLLYIYADTLSFTDNKLDILNRLKAVLDKVSSSPKFGIYLIFLQEEHFQNTLSEIVESETEASEAAQLLLTMTNIEDGENLF